MEGRIDEDRAAAEPERIILTAKIGKWVSILADISALASMKNVAKCDTWCELQDPANHRVFERKLRPEPSGRGHVCLGVTHRCPPHTTPHAGSLRRQGHTLASRAHRRADGLNSSPRRTSSRHYGG